MEKNSYVSIWGYGVCVLDETLNVYAEWDKFQRFGIARKECESERKEIFLETLVHEGKIGLPDDAEVVPTVMPRYFSWKLTATEEDINAMRDMIRPEVFDPMDPYEREMFATGYRQPLFKKANFSRATFLHWLSDESVGSMEEKKMTIFRSYMEDLREKAVAMQGFAIQNVNGGDNQPQYSYTISLTEKTGVELVLVNAGPGSPEIIVDQAKALIKAGLPKLKSVRHTDPAVMSINGWVLTQSKPFIIEGFTVGPAKEPLRAEMVEIDMESPTAKQMLGAINAGMKRCIQIRIGDKNNILPSEPGYDGGFVQELGEVADESAE